MTYGGRAFHGDSDVPLSYVEQDPRFFSNLTVRETLHLDARLHGGDASDVDRVIKRLGLVACADTFVGGDTGGKAVRGISGGGDADSPSRRDPVPPPRGRDADLDDEADHHHHRVDRGSGGVILADEPTTGLDAHQADKIVEKLAETAENPPPLCVLHQPRSAIFERLDDPRCSPRAAAWRTAAPRDALAHFAALDACPVHNNPAEFLSDLVAVDTDGADAGRRIGRGWTNSCAAGSNRDGRGDGRGPRLCRPRERDEKRRSRNPGRGPRGRGRGRGRGPGALGQFRLLVGRAWKQTRRERGSTAFASSPPRASRWPRRCNYKVGLSAKSVKRRAAVLMQAAINTSMLAICRSLNGFPRERATVAREMARKRGGYRAGRISSPNCSSRPPWTCSSRWCSAA